MRFKKLWAIFLCSIMFMGNLTPVIAEVTQSDTPDTEEVSEANIVEGSDGLLYAVSSESSEKPLETSSVEVGVDKKRLKSAESMKDDSIKDFEDVDFDNVKDLQSALNNPKFPFLSESEAESLSVKAKSSSEMESIAKQTKSYFVDRILSLSHNLNDVPDVAGMTRSELMTRASVKENKLYPRNGGAWTMIYNSYFHDGMQYMENYSVRRTINGVEAFCIEAGKIGAGSYTGKTTGLSSNEKRNMDAIISAYEQLGGFAKTGDEGWKLWVAAQQLIWAESPHPPSQMQTMASFDKDVKSYKSDITTRAKKFKTKTSFDATTKTVNMGQNATFSMKTDASAYGIIVLNATGGATARRSGNNIIVDTSKATADSVTVNLVKTAETKPGSGKPQKKLTDTIWSNGDYQRLFSGNIYDTYSLKVNIIRERKLTIRHIDKVTKKLLKEESQKKKVGTTYEFKPRTDLVDGEGHKYVSHTTVKGTMPNKDIVLEIPYYIPSVTTSIDKVTITTDLAKAGGSLPGEVYLSKKVEYPEDISNVEFDLVVKDLATNKEVSHTPFSLKGFKDKLSIKLPSDYLKKDMKVNYSFNIKVLKNPDKVKLPATAELKTEGYSSSEAIVKANDAKEGKVSYKGVGMTEKVKDKAIKYYYEGFDINFDKVKPTKTGYGQEVNYGLTYFDEVKAFDESLLGIDMYVPSVLVEDTLKYKKVDDDSKIKLDIVKLQSNKDGKEKVLDMALPNIFVEKQSGNLYSELSEQKDLEFIKAGRKLYVPIWAKKKAYEFVSMSKERTGANKVSFEITHNLDVYANMYETIDSKTKKYDELLMTPLFPDKTNELKGWSAEELAWLKK